MPRRRRLVVPLVAAVVALVALLPATASAHARHHDHSAHHHPALSLAWRDLDSGSTSHFRGLSVVNRKVVWLGGYDGVVLRTVDGGRTWQDVSPPEAVAQGLQFRDVAAFSRRTAVLLAAGEVQASQLWRTDDGGATWTVTRVNEDPSGFYDCMAFWDRRHGIAVGDPVDGAWQVLLTRDGGRSWRLADDLPQAAPGEFGFAGSGTCVAVAGHRDAWIGTGGGAARVLHSADRGRSWTAADTPIASDPAGAGIFSVAFRNPWQGIAVGGNFNTPDVGDDAAAWSADGGRTWQPAREPVGGYRSGSAWLPHLRRTAVAVGPTGSDVTFDGGRTWSGFDTSSLDSVECGRDGACFGSGEAGRVARLVVRR